ncbi:hypothetical protein [Ferrimonas senticii]|uniref:hypothetical protein n=1 Tax=Ferrimonas senticii TaxID=394566 RepID=UPI0003FF37F2|nr:hypothetical protein [Ferrimonas senticii]
MKRWLALILLTTCATAQSHDHSDSHHSQWEIVGTVKASCQLQVTPIKDHDNLTLDGSKGKRQATAKITVVCNDGRDRIETLYRSENGGLRHDDSSDNLIHYTAHIAGNKFDIDDKQWHSVMQQSGQNTKFSITPALNGRQLAGTYRDTIHVRVAID